MDYKTEEMNKYDEVVGTQGLIVEEGTWEHKKEPYGDKLDLEELMSFCDFWNMFQYVCIYTCVCMYMCAHIYVYICMWVHIYMHMFSVCWKGLETIHPSGSEHTLH